MLGDPPMGDEDVLEEYLAVYGDSDELRHAFARTSSFHRAFALVERDRLRAGGWDVDNLTDDEILTGWVANVFPNVQISLGRARFMWRIRPNGMDPESSLLEYWTLKETQSGLEVPNDVPVTWYPEGTLFSDAIGHVPEASVFDQD